MLIILVIGFSPCLEGWTYSNQSGSCYKRLSRENSYNWSEARDICKSFDNSSELLYLDEPGEEEIIYTFYLQFDKYFSWIGAEIKDGKIISIFLLFPED